MKRLLILTSFVFSMGAFAAETKVKLVKSKGSKHIIMTSSNLGYHKNGTLTISDGDAKTVDFKILKVNKEGNKLLIQGPENVSVEDLCSFSCVGTTAGASLEDEFGSEFSDRSPASTPNESKATTASTDTNGYWNVGFGMSNNYTPENDSVKGTERSFDSVLTFSGEKFLFQKDLGQIVAKISLGGELLFLSRDLKKGDVIAIDEGVSVAIPADDWTISVLQPSANINFYIIPHQMVHFFIGGKLNYSLLTDNEYEGDLGNVNPIFSGINGKIGTEYSGGVSFGFQTGLNVSFNNFLIQIKYQANTIPTESVLYSEIAGTRTNLDPVKADLVTEQFLLSVGMTF
jgi:hypothetical protein